MVIETGNNYAVWSVAFHSDGMQLLSGKTDGVRRWRVADGQEVGNRMPMNVNVISVSMDGKWTVCGTTRGASVWDAKTQEKAIEVEDTHDVTAVDISPESTRFATGTGQKKSDYKVSIWNIITGERLVGPLQHVHRIAGIKFSPNGEYIATANRGPDAIRIFDSRNGDQLISIKTDVLYWGSSTPLAWSNNGQHIFAASSDRKIKSFEVSTGSQLAGSEVPGEDSSMGESSTKIREVYSIALAANGKFLATFANSSISFWDTPTLTQIGPVIEDSQRIRSIALSLDCSSLATGGMDGNITIRKLNNILSDLYGPFRVSICALTILSDKSHTAFPISVSPLGTYSRRS